ncbi:MAG: hypothetical protein EXR70_18870 [Deltaproteobacteria bacterium]|nr:hypothetical protein [Deltaproteobacteria bacterium]
MKSIKTVLLTGLLVAGLSSVSLPVGAAEKGDMMEHDKGKMKDDKGMMKDDMKEKMKGKGETEGDKMKMEDKMKTDDKMKK